MLLRGRRDGRGHGVPVVCPLLPAASLLWRAGVPEGPAPDTQPDAAAVHSGPCTAPATPGRTAPAVGGSGSRPCGLGPPPSPQPPCSSQTAPVPAPSRPPPHSPRGGPSSWRRHVSPDTHRTRNAGRAGGGRREARAAPVGTAVGSPCRSAGELALTDAPVQGSEGPRPSPPPRRRHPASCSHHQVSSSCSHRASASWAGLSPEPSLCPHTSQSCRTRRGCSPAAQGAPLFAGCGGRDAPPVGWEVLGGPEPSRGLIWAQRSEVQCSATPRWLPPQTGLRRGLPAPRIRSSHRCFFSKRPPSVLWSPHTAARAWETLGADGSAAGGPSELRSAAQGLLPHPPVGNSNNNVSC